MKLTVLGSGVPLSSAERACSGYLIESQGQHIVVDLGTGAFKNLETVIHPKEISAIFISHFDHFDHVADLVGFIGNRRLFCRVNPNEAKQLNIFGPTGIETFVKKILELFPGFAELNFPVWAEEMKYSAKKFFGFTIKSKPVKHSRDSIGFRIEAEGKILAYSGDTEMCDEIVDLGQNSDLLVLECTFPGTAKHEGHLNPAECGEIAKKANAKRLLLTHFDPTAEDADLIPLAAKNFSGEIILARDLLEIDI